MGHPPCLSYMGTRYFSKVVTRCGLGNRACFPRISARHRGTLVEDHPSPKTRKPAVFGGLFLSVSILAI